MGQKVSSLGDAFSWKNADSSKNNDTPTAGARNSPRSSIPAVTSVPVCAVHGVPVTGDQPQYENIYVSNSDAPSTSAVEDHHVNGYQAPSTAAVVETATSKSIQPSTKSTAGSKKLNHWVLRFNCSRPKSKSSKCFSPPENIPPVASEVKCETCVCTHYKRTEDNVHVSPDVVYDPEPPVEDEYQNEDEESSQDMLDFEGAFNAFNASFDNRSDLVLPSFDEGLMDLNSDVSGEEFMNVDFEDRAYKERAKEIQEGIEPPPGFRPGLHIQLVEFSLPKMTIDNLTSLFHRAAITALNAPHDMDDSHRIHTSIDYIHYLVPDLLQITNCSFYWGKMDRYEAEKLLENKSEGTFLLRDSAQEEYLFSVSFRKYGRSLHARIEQWNHLFSFDSRDPGVFASSTVCGLIEHYKDPTCCMFFEPMLTIPLHRNFTFSLQHTCRAAICSQITYDDVNQLKLPKLLKSYLKEYHYKQRVRVRIFDSEN